MDTTIDETGAGGQGPDRPRVEESRRQAVLDGLLERPSTDLVADRYHFAFGKRDNGPSQMTRMQQVA
jgi:hypothetical protein